MPVNKLKKGRKCQVCSCEDRKCVCQKCIPVVCTECGKENCPICLNSKPYNSQQEVANKKAKKESLFVRGWKFFHRSVEGSSARPEPSISRVARLRKSYGGKSSQKCIPEGAMLNEDVYTLHSAANVDVNRITYGEIITVRKTAKKTSETIIRREYQLLLQLDHDNIIKVFKSEYSFFEMDYMTFTFGENKECNDLGQYVEKLSGIENPPQRHIDELIDVTGHIMSAIEYIHQKQIVHRDIKPSNILLGSNTQGHIIGKLADFGSATMLTNPSSGTMSYGTIPFMAPEQILHNNQLSKSIDVWGFGCILFCMLNPSLKYPYDMEAKSRRESRGDEHSINKSIRDNTLLRLIKEQFELQSLPEFSRPNDSILKRLSKLEVLMVHAVMFDTETRWSIQGLNDTFRKCRNDLEICSKLEETDVAPIRFNEENTFFCPNSPKYSGDVLKSKLFGVTRIPVRRVLQNKNGILVTFQRNLGIAKLRRDITASAYRNLQFQRVDLSTSMAVMNSQTVDLSVISLKLKTDEANVSLVGSTCILKYSTRKDLESFLHSDVSIFGQEAFCIIYYDCLGVPDISENWTTRL